MLALLFIVFVVLLLFGVEIFYAMGIASLVYLITTLGGPMPIPLTLVPQQLVAGVDSFPLLAIPMFLLAGELMARGGVTDRLVQFSVSVVGHIKGGLAQVAILVNMIMAGMSGSSIADLAATGRLLIPTMASRGYPAAFAGAVVAAASTMGPVIPPSLPMVIIGSLVSVSVGQLFLGGVVPGIVMGIALMLVTYRFAKLARLPVEPRATASEFRRSTRDALLALFMPVIVLGAIISGLATPTEASVVAVVYAMFLGLFVYRELKLSELPDLFAGVAVSSAVIMITVAAAQLFGWITTAEGLAIVLAGWLTAFGDSPYLVLLIVNVVLLVLGMVMEPIPIMLLTVPILFPVITSLGVDPVHFGVVVTLNLMIGCLTPPIGLNIMMASVISGVPVMRVTRSAWAFMIILVGVLLLITYVPALVLWLPDLVYN